MVQGWQWGNVGGTENLQEMVVRLEESFDETVFSGQSKRPT